MELDDQGNEIPAGSADSAPANTTADDTGTQDDSGTSTDGGATETGAASGDGTVLGDKGLEELKQQRQKRQMLEEENRQLREQISNSFRGQQQPVHQQPQQPNYGPQPDQFDTWEKYQEARIDFVAGVKADAAVTSRLTQQTFNQRLMNSAAKDPKVAEALTDSIMPRFTTPAIAEALRSSETPGEVLVYLRENLTDMIRISQMSPVAQIKEMGKIEDRIAAQQKRTPTTKVVSGAPAPARTLSGAKGGSSAADEDTLSTEEYMKRERERAAGPPRQRR